MTYRRLIPEDLFNEASLLKCLGRVYLGLESTVGARARLSADELPVFEIVQRKTDRAIFVEDLELLIDKEVYRLTRPADSRSLWALHVERVADQKASQVDVFDEDGHFTERFRQLVTAGGDNQ